MFFSLWEGENPMQATIDLEILLFCFRFSLSAESVGRTAGDKSLKWMKKKMFFRVETLICLPHPQTEKLLLCLRLVLHFGEKKRPPKLRKYDAMHDCIFSPTVYLVCIFKVCLFHAWLTLILAITCRGKLIMNPLAIIELIKHLFYSLSVL